MRTLHVAQNEAGKRLDKLLLTYMNEASMGFLFKMLRKKNITLNGKKAAGNEILSVGDEIKLFLSDETIDKFSTSKKPIVNQIKNSENEKLDIIYEDSDILLVNKPSGMLSQKSSADDVSLNEYCLYYLMNSGIVTEESLRTFKPSICNRLDRNTSGIVIFGKSLRGVQVMSDALKQRTLHKFYQCIVAGKLEGEKTIKGFLHKDETKNHVMIFENKVENASYIETKYIPLQYIECENGILTLLEVELITGKPHQIRAHLASINHPIIGDYKYGNRNINEYYRKVYRIDSQLLHAYRLVMPKLNEPMKHLSEREFQTKLPDAFINILSNQKKFKCNR